MISVLMMLEKLGGEGGSVGLTVMFAVSAEVMVPMEAGTVVFEVGSAEVDIFDVVVGKPMVPVALVIGLVELALGVGMPVPVPVPGIDVTLSGRVGAVVGGLVELALGVGRPVPGPGTDVTLKGRVGAGVGGDVELALGVGRPVPEPGTEVTLSGGEVGAVVGGVVESALGIDRPLEGPGVEVMFVNGIGEPDRGGKTPVLGIVILLGPVGTPLGADEDVYEPVRGLPVVVGGGPVVKIVPLMGAVGPPLRAELTLDGSSGDGRPLVPGIVMFEELVGNPDDGRALVLFAGMGETVIICVVVVVVLVPGSVIV